MEQLVSAACLRKLPRKHGRQRTTPHPNSTQSGISRTEARLEEGGHGKRGCNVESKKRMTAVIPQCVTVFDKRGSVNRAHDESSEPSCTLAHAPAAVPRSRNWSLCFAMDAITRVERLLGHGRGAQGVSAVSRHMQCCAVAGNSARRIRQRKI